MPAIKDRGEGNAKRRDRLAQLKKGAGEFVYDGTSVDTEWIPTPMLVGKGVPMLDAQGFPVMDAAGRQRFVPSSMPARDGQGNILMGGEPKKVSKPVEVFKIWGVEFPKGKPVHVGAALALKLRGMDCFKEVEAKGKAPKGDEASK